ncbi:hypothetical protein GWK48_10945 [Metallosphaera tengchongensis]|uniref:Uncharacterized protein n=1 Tax=Metallosphaera tengchongensis TaxID=1532350 RepID=A0A6N0P0M6_9CREN|nr:hypothetical protein [Metallosphaera tengchongensis]QKR00830.1 hypothetical protein GWK48_10945 [Metallosphaera tengchongensis]
MEKKEEKKNLTAEESRSYYTEAKGDVEDIVETPPQIKVENRSVMSPPPSIMKAPANVEEPKSRLRKTVIKTLLFPGPPVVGVSSQHTDNYLTASVTSQGHTTAITPLYFPSPLSVTVLQLDLKDYLTAKVSKNVEMIQPLQFPTTSQVILNPLDAEVYLEVREKYTLEFTPSEEIATQSNLQVSVSSPQPKTNIYIKSSVYDDFLSQFSSLLKASGVNIVVYDEMKPKIEDSLVSLGTEIALINGFKVEPQEISTKNPSSIPLLGSAGVFKVDKSLCDVKDRKELINQIENLLTKIMGYQFSIQIVPSCFYSQYLINIGGKPNRIFVDEDVLKHLSNMIRHKLVSTYKVNKDVIQKLAFGASGLQLDFPSYDAPANFKSPFTTILDDAQNWLTLNYPNLDKSSPSGGQEGEYHRKMKPVVIKHLLENLKIDPNSIHMEQKVHDCGVPDIYFNDKNGKVIGVDVKASMGKMPRDEIDEAYNKYEQCSNEVWVVLRPLPALLDLNGIIGKYKIYNKLRIFIPAVCEGNKISLLPLEEFVDKMEKLQTC